MIKTDETFLVLIDVQEKLLSAMYDSQGVLDSVVRLVKGAKALGLPIVWLEQNPNGLGPTTQAVAEVLDGEEPIVKLSFSGCGNQDFMRTIKALNRKTALICGIEAHVCVYQTARDLKEAGYEVQVAFDATSSRKLENKMIALESLKAAGSTITSVETALFDLLKVAEGDTFKKILAIIK